jgi:hypothetical protein
MGFSFNGSEKRGLYFRTGGGGGLERRVRAAEHTHLSSAEVKNGGAKPSLPHSFPKRGA